MSPVPTFFRRARRLARGAALAALLALACLGGCARRGAFVEGRPAEDGSMQAELTQAGRLHVLTRRPPAEGPWRGLLLANEGPGLLSGITLWTPGGATLFRDEFGSGRSRPAKFSLLPGQRLACAWTIGDAQAQSGQPVEDETLTGSFLWEPPADAARLGGKGFDLKRAKALGQGRIELEPGQGEAWFEARYELPVGLSRARLSWDAEPEGAVPEAWIAVEGGAWGRLPVSRRRPAWQHPIELTSSVQDQRRFRIRVGYRRAQADARGEEPARPAGPERLTLTRLRLEGEFTAPAELGPWPTGLTEWIIELASPGGAPPRLKLRLE